MTHPDVERAELIAEARAFVSWLRAETFGNAPSTKLPSDVIEALADALSRAHQPAAPTTENEHVRRSNASNTGRRAGDESLESLSADRRVPEHDAVGGSVQQGTDLGGLHRGLAEGGRRDQAAVATPEAVARVIENAKQRMAALLVAVDHWPTESKEDQQFLQTVDDVEESVIELCALLPSPVQAGWRPMADALKNGEPVLALFKTPIPDRDDLERWAGLQAVIRHNGLAPDGFDIGWQIAAPVGAGGFPDSWLVGWQPLPSAAPVVGEG